MTDGVKKEEEDEKEVKINVIKSEDVMKKDLENS